MVKAFEIGHAYATRSLSDYDSIFRFRILGRTAKTVQIRLDGKNVIRKIKVRDGVESFKPFGTYSMCAVIYADDRAEALALTAA